MKKNLNFKSAIVMFLFTLPVQSYAESLVGVVSKGDSSIQYNVDVNTGEYSIDLKNTYNPKLVISASDLEKIHCRNEEAFVKGAFGGLSISDYKRDSVKIGLSLSDISLSNIEKKISEDILRKGYVVPKLLRATKFYVVSPEPEFEWEASALSIKARSNISQILQERFRKFVMERETFENYNNLETAYLDMPIHLFVCDLIKKDVSIKWHSSIEIHNQKKKDSPLSKSQILNLNNYLLANIDKLKTPSSNLDMDEDERKIVNSSGLLAFGLAKQGIDSSFVASKYFESLFFRMFGVPSRLPKKLSDSEVEDVQKSITEEVLTAGDAINLSKELKVEVLK